MSRPSPRPSVVERLTRSVRPVVSFLDDRLARITARPVSVGAAVRASARLRRAGRFDEADAVVAAGLAAFGDRRDLLVAGAMNANDAGRYVEALARWRRLRDAHPDLAIAWCGVAANARMRDDLETATMAMDEALRSFPDDIVVTSEGARVADRRGDPAVALPLWSSLRERPDAEPEWLQGYVTNLILVRRFDEAAVEIDRAVGLHPDHVGLVATRGILSMALERWDEAMIFWRAYRIRFPDDWTGWMNIGLVTNARNLAKADSGLVGSQASGSDVSGLHVVDAPVEVDRVEDETVRGLMLRFESLGADCEFGTVQRRYGAEPLSLLRWSTVPVQSLQAALAVRFQGLGDPATTEMPVFRNEYILGDTRWGFKMHTFLPPSQHEYDAVFPKMCRRLAYLRDKLLADLERGEKMFVYKGLHAGLRDVREMHARMRRLGPARLVWVRLSGASDDIEHPGGRPGEVREIGEDLFVGFISRAGSILGRWDIAFDDWVEICREAERLAMRVPA